MSQSVLLEKICNHSYSALTSTTTIAGHHTKQYSLSVVEPDFSSKQEQIQTTSRTNSCDISTPKLPKGQKVSIFEGLVNWIVDDKQVISVVENVMCRNVV